MIPLFYQLIEAYHPVSYPSANISIVVTPTPTASIASNPVPSITPAPVVTQIPQNVGGEGTVTTIAVLGDSMVQTLGSNLSALKYSLHQYFPTGVFNLLNFGTGSQNIEYGQKYELPDALSQNPDIFIIESFAYNNFGNTESGINRQWLALGAITSEIKQKLPHAKIIIAATIAPNSVVFANGIKDLHFSALEKTEKASTIKLYLQNAVNFASSQGFPLVDAYHFSLFGNEGLNDFINSSDNLHPSAQGAELFSDLIADTISRNKLLD